MFLCNHEKEKKMNNCEKAYFFHYPGMVYAEIWYAKNIKEVKELIKKEYHIKRMPNGYAIWEVRR